MRGDKEERNVRIRRVFECALKQAFQSIIPHIDLFGHLVSGSFRPVDPPEHRSDVVCVTHVPHGHFSAAEIFLADHQRPVYRFRIDAVALRDCPLIGRGAFRRKHGGKTRSVKRVARDLDAA